MNAFLLRRRSITFTNQISKKGSFGTVVNKQKTLNVCRVLAKPFD